MLATSVCGEHAEMNGQISPGSGALSVVVDL
jgi:hypothetical protein